MWKLLPGGSWLACDADTSVCQLSRVDAIAGKPAPTQASSHIDRASTQILYASDWF
ncbi:hypothetical protein SAMN04515675_5867 [Pseudomonas costantinii]|uniref:Uncharacterized protein n=1 Tax=Pseudomonas costantinii TaxID=168469 RepID=A0A1H5JAR3_9PSED|nr:hypothetical protein SAMN04515675_5867 [Pseudomonas costantinii]